MEAPTDDTLQESGYLFLEDVEITLLSDANESLSNTLPDERWHSSLENRWLPVSFAQKEDMDEQQNTTNTAERDFCTHCHLVIQCQSSDWESRSRALENSFVVAGPTPRFDGTITDLKPCDTHCTCSTKLRQRSDAALLLGLALTCQDLGHVAIRSMQILLEGPGPDASSRHRSTIAITIHIPEIRTEQRQSIHLPEQSRRKRTQSTTRSPQKRRFVADSSKPLPPSTQLLLSILRSDWSFLDLIRENPILLKDAKRSDLNTNHSPVTFFPPKLALEEVYHRIGSATTPLRSIMNIALPHDSSKSKSIIACMDLPKDVWQYHIGSYLRAKSLDSLRCTSKYFHQILQEVVPGLRLRLFDHQVKSLLWMRSREIKAITENELALGGKSWHDDLHNAATGGATVLLQNRRMANDSDRPQPSSVHRISQYNGEEVILRFDDPLSRKIARGGLLCDDPGLGKTITVLSLILQTLGLTTTPTVADYDTEQSNDDKEVAYRERIFTEYWREQSIPQFRCQALNKLFSTFIRKHRESAIFMLPVSPEKDGVPDYFDIISNPICFQDIRKRINQYQYDHSFSTFQSDVLQCFQNAVIYHPSDSEVYQAAKRMETSFLQTVDEFKQKQVQTARKSFGRSSSKPNSSVAALVELQNRAKLQNALIQSSGTLLVVPSVLLEHWQDQIRLHIDTTYCTSKIAIIFEFTGTAESNLRLEEIVRECQVDNTHSAFVFVDKTTTRKLPSPQFLAMFSIVITTTQRFTNEWKNGSFEDELRQEESRQYEDSYPEHDLQAYLANTEAACPLLKVNWLRMIVDEGHSMGRGHENSAILFASWISAERRWAMTGTPTRRVVSHSGLSSILNLLNYLQHGFFSHRHDGSSVWQSLIARTWSGGMLSAFFRLRKLLALVMVRHTKSDIKELALPNYKSTILPMSMEEMKTYNTLVCGIQSNLAITSMEGETSGLQDSLLHRSQLRHARHALRNVRLVCAGGTQVIPTVTEKFWKEFLDFFTEENPDAEMLEKMKGYLSRATTDSVSPCDCCGMLLTTLLVIQCGHLVCTECFDPQSDSCIVCDQRFDIDDFQRLQPGMDYQWLHNIEEEEKRNKGKATASSRDMNVDSAPIQLLDDGRGMLAPLDPSRERRRTAKPGDGHTCVYNPKQVNGECDLCWKEHDFCNLVNATGRCEVCFRIASHCPDFETKPSYVLQRLLSLHEEQRKRQLPVKVNRGDCLPLDPIRPVKAIVFSQFRSVLNAVGDRLIRRCGTACIAEYWGQFRKQELHKFIYDDQCFCMLLGKDGSEGLDLSFVTHIFFLEQVWDKSLEQQVVARAWRMGATGRVEVETLIAERSVEELMGRFEAELQSGSEPSLAADLQGMQDATEAGKSSDYQRAKLHFLLKNLRLITSSATNPLGAGSKVPKEDVTEGKQVSSIAKVPKEDVAEGKQVSAIATSLENKKRSPLRVNEELGSQIKRRRVCFDLG